MGARQKCGDWQHSLFVALLRKAHAKEEPEGR
jgi:hypothetical protein